MSKPSLPYRIVVGGDDDEMALIIRIATAVGIPVVRAHPSDVRGADQYASPVAPEAGDVWIECAPAPRAFGPYTRIDHHQPGDPGYGVTGFEGSSLGQFLRLLLEAGAHPHTLGMWDLDDPTVYGFDPGWADCGGPYGYGFGMWIKEGEAYGVPGFHWFKVPPQWEATGLADHDPVGFAAGHYGRWDRTAAREFLIARAASGGRGFTAADVAEALRLIEAAPTVPGFPQVYDLRTVPELTPPVVRAGQPVPGTGGRLGSAAFVAALCLPGKAVLNWGAQGDVPGKGRHLGLIGNTAGFDPLAVLAAVEGIVGIYGAPRKACGGYLPAVVDYATCGACNGPVYATAAGPECGCNWGRA